MVQSWKWPWSASGRGDTGACIWHSSCSNNIFTFFIEFSLFILVCHWPSNMKRENLKKVKWMDNPQQGCGIFPQSYILLMLDEIGKVRKWQRLEAENLRFSSHKKCKFAHRLFRTLCTNEFALVSMMKELVWKFIAHFEEVWIRRIICWKQV